MLRLGALLFVAILAVNVTQVILLVWGIVQLRAFTRRVMGMLISNGWSLKKEKDGP